MSERGLEALLNKVDYSYLGKGYVPSPFALEFIAFIKLVNGVEGEENKPALIHYDMMDQFSGTSKHIQNLFVAFRGASKALPLTTPIPTPYGYKTMKEIAVGDYIFSRNGGATEVTSVSPIFIKPVYRISLEDGRFLDVCEDHLNIVVDEQGAEKVVPTKELLNISERFYIPLSKGVLYDHKKLPVDPYTLGCILSNAVIPKHTFSPVLNVSKELGLHIIDKIPYPAHMQDKHIMPSYLTHIKGVHKALREVVNIEDRTFHEDYLYASKEQRMELLQGIMDTSNLDELEEALKAQVVTLVNSLGGYVKDDVVHMEECPYSFPDKVKEWVPCSGKLEVIGIEEVPVVPSKCITVSCPSESFLAKDYLVTHNTSVLHEYFILYLATYGGLKGFGEVHAGMYISDTMENGVKNMRKNLEERWETSQFLQKYVPKTKFTEDLWEFENIDGKRLGYGGFAVGSRIRGFKYRKKRPSTCHLDDLLSENNVNSPGVLSDIEDLVYGAARQAMGPGKRLLSWTGTPFNKSDPIHSAAESKSWNTRVYPVCEQFPVEKKDFRGAWPDRFDFNFVKREYTSLLESGKIDMFNRELMLRVASEEDRLVKDDDLVWYSRDKVFINKSRYNFYVTTDFATSNRPKADYSVIMVWAYTNNGDWMLVDGICKRQLMDKNIEQLFKFCSVYKPLSVGIEINGQQKGFIEWIREKQIEKNTYFNLAGPNSEGIRRSGKKIEYFKLFLPVIKAKKLWLPTELKNHELVVELLEEFRYTTEEKCAAKNDDVLDGVSMLMEMSPYKPSQESLPKVKDYGGESFAWFDEDYDEELNSVGSTIF